ncbi:MAG: sugar transferase [Candidatus Acidiferrales bacterium]
MKRAIDVLFGTATVVICLPLSIIVAIVIFLDSGWPVFYTDQRLGRFGRAFRCLKFRTMHLNSDGVLSAYLEAHPEAAEHYRKYRKLVGRDPRVTGVGQFLRRWSLDELPQFINVVKGDMSMIGPRPFTARESTLRSGVLDIILSVRPGISGIWQVNGRDHCTIEERVECDVQYARSNNILLDLVILAKTFGAVVHHGRVEPVADDIAIESSRETGSRSATNTHPQSGDRRSLSSDGIQ